MSEGPGAVGAGGRCLAGMVLGGATEIHLWGKVLGTLGTGQGVLSGVATLMCHQHVLAEALAAVVAREQLLSSWRWERVAS